MFKAFKDWLYTRRLPEKDSRDSRYTLLCKLWVLGDRRDVPLLQNECIDKLLSAMCSRSSVATNQLPYIYSNTVAGSLLRRFIIDVFSKRFESTDFDSPCASDWSEESLRGLARALMVRPEREKWSVLVDKACDWHVHEEGVKCKK